MSNQPLQAYSNQPRPSSDSGMHGRSQVSVRFVTESEQYRIVDSPFSVPAKLGRHGLSEIINHVIASDAGNHLSVVFDFLIDGKLLRVPLQSFIERHRLSTEHIIVVTYFPAVRFSDEAESTEAPSWVGSIDSCRDPNSGVVSVATGCFNGQVKLFLDGGDYSLSEVATVEAHDEPIRSVLTWVVDSSEQRLLTASKDKTIKLWRCTPAAADRQQVQLVATLRGHLTSVESLSRWSRGGGALLSGDWSGNIFAWNLVGFGPSDSNNDRSIRTIQEEERGGGRVVKKSKTGSHSSTAVSYEAGGGGVGAKPLFSLRAHSQCVTGIEVLEGTGSMLTCSWDHSWKAWDLERQDCISTCVSSRVFTSMHVQGGGKPLVLSSHPDGKCRLWDMDSNSSKASFGRSSDWISQVRWCPSSYENVFAATDYSGGVSLWDIRHSSVPLSRIEEAHSGKALCAHWIEVNKPMLSEQPGSCPAVLSGGSDCCLRSTPLTDGASNRIEQLEYSNHLTNEGDDSDTFRYHPDSGDDSGIQNHPDDAVSCDEALEHDDDDSKTKASSSSSRPKAIRRKVVQLEKAVLLGSSVAVRMEQFFFLEETTVTAVDKQQLQLNLIRNCSRHTPDCSPVMPLLRLEMADREYHEPIRDRDKNWVLDSQRHIINLKGSEPIGFDLDLGHYPRNDLYRSSKLFWAAEHQSFFRETRLLRRSKMISETNCVVEVFGVGFNGRLFSEGSSKPKFIVIEVYSIWNCQKYVAALNLLELRFLLGERTDLLRPGRKMALINSIVDGLYFKYTIKYSIAEKMGAPTTTSDASIAADPSPNPTIPSSGSSQHGVEERTVVVVHLERPQMPKGYPRTVEQMIRTPHPVPPQDSTAPLPVVQQELLLGIEERRNGIVLRMLEAAERKKLQDEEDRRLHLLWLATKKRRRGLVGLQVVRGDTHFAVVAAYHEPIRPATILLKATLMGEAVPIKMFLGLNSIQNLLKVQSSSLKWSSDEVRSFTSRALRFVKLVPSADSRLGLKTLKLNELSGTDGRLVKVKSLAKNLESMVGRRKRATLTLTAADLNMARDKSNHDDVDGRRDEDIGLGSASALSTGYSWCSLGMNGRARRAVGALGVHSKPLRDVGRGIRLTSRATSVSGIHCIYTLYARCMLGPAGPIPVWPPPIEKGVGLGVEEVDHPIEQLLKQNADDATVDDAGNDVYLVEEQYETESGQSASDDGDDEAMIQSNAEVDRKNESFDKIANGAQFDLFVYIPYGGVVADKVVAACSHYTLSFARDAFDTLVGSSAAAAAANDRPRELLGTALRSLYRRFFDEASPEEVSQAEGAWDLIGREIMLRCRWDSTSDRHDDALMGPMDCSSRYSYVSSLTRTFAKRVVGREAARPIEVADSSSSSSSSIGETADNAPPLPVCEEATLSWSDIIFRKTMKIRSAAPSRGETVTLQVVVAQKTQDIAVICFDQLTNDVYSAGHADKDLIASHLINYRFLPEKDRMLQIFFFVLSQLTYTEVPDKNNMLRGMVTFEAVQEEAAVIDLSEVMEEDYSSNTEMMLAAAQEKAKNRLKRDIKE